MQDFIKNEKDFYNFIKNKSLIIVGPSKNLENKKMGKFIDSHDIVIRLNNSFPILYNKEVSHEDVGTRTDIIYHTGAIKKVLELIYEKYKIDKSEILKADKIKYFVSKRDPIVGTRLEKKYTSDFVKIIRNDIKILTVHKKFLVKLRKNLKNTDPNMSTIAFIHLLKFKFKSCRIIGCDFYSSGYNKSYFIPNTLIFDEKSKKLIRKDGRKRRKPKIPHDTKIQIRFLLKVLKNDKRFIINDLKKWKKIIAN